MSRCQRSRSLWHRNGRLCCLVTDRMGNQIRIWQMRQLLTPSSMRLPHHCSRKVATIATLLERGGVRTDQNVRMACSRRDQGRETRRADLQAMEPWLLMGPWAWAWEAMACVWHPHIHFLMFCNIMLHHLLRMAAFWDASCQFFAIL